MKKQLLLLLSVVLFITPAFAQLRKIPAEVTDAFKTKYPAASAISWSDKLTSFGASFTFNKEKLTADFSPKGVWKKTEKDIETDTLPSEIKESFTSSKYSTDWKIKAARSIENADLSIEYRLLIEKSALQKKYLYLTPDGQIVKEVVTL